MPFNASNLINIDDETCEHEHAWSITARLAALPPIVITLVGAELAGLIQESRDLHPMMAAAAQERAFSMTE